jgi:hypothetical protein
MGLKGYRLWVMGQLDSTCRPPTTGSTSHCALAGVAITAVSASPTVASDHGFETASLPALLLREDLPPPYLLNLGVEAAAPFSRPLPPPVNTARLWVILPPPCALAVAALTSIPVLLLQSTLGSLHSVLHSLRGNTPPPAATAGPLPFTVTGRCGDG